MGVSMKNLIIIPAYNEEEALPKTLTCLEPLADHFEVVVINDGSPDRTGEVAERFARESRLKIHVIHLPVNGGIGVAMQTGYLFCLKKGCYQYAIQFDADGQHDASSLEALVNECETRRLDICIGSRFLQSVEGNFQSTFARRIGIRFFCRLISSLSGVKVSDPTSGFRCAGPSAWKQFAQRYPDDYPEPESLFWCARNRLKIGEIPVRMYERQGGVTSIRHLKTVYYMFKVSLAILVDRIRPKEFLNHESEC
jgi:glycosyltransferase involved in cell wall biosynthesis